MVAHTGYFSNYIYSDLYILRERLEQFDVERIMEGVDVEAY
jgi:hypothetical protein